MKCNVQNIFSFNLSFFPAFPCLYFFLSFPLPFLLLLTLRSIISHLSATCHLSLILSIASITGCLSSPSHAAGKLKSIELIQRYDNAHNDTDDNEKKKTSHGEKEDTNHHNINNENYESNENDKGRDNKVVLSRNSLKRLLIYTADSALQLSKKEKLIHMPSSILEDSSFPYNYTPKTLTQYVREIWKAKVFCSYNILIINFSNILCRSKRSGGRKVVGYSTEKVWMYMRMLSV